MELLPTVSIIVPVYNRKSFLPQLFGCLKKQSFTDFECIIVDDGSSDGSGEVCDSLAENDSRFRIFHQENRGVSIARNFGLSKARGEFITFVDSGDGLHPDYLKNLLDCIEKSGADIVIGSYANIELKDGRRIDAVRNKKGLFEIEAVTDSFAQDQAETGVYGACWSKIFRREIAEDIKFDENLKLLEDFDFNLKIYRKVKTIYFDDKPYYYYFHGAKNSSQTVSDDKIDYRAQLTINLRYRAFLQSAGGYAGRNREIADELIGRYIFLTLFYCPAERLRGCFGELREAILGDGITYTFDGGMFGRLVLRMFHGNRFFAVKLLLSGYRAGRYVKRKLTNGGE